VTTDLTHTAVHAALVARLNELNVSGWTIGSEHDPRCSSDESACMQMCPIPVQEYLSAADVTSDILATVLDMLGVDPSTLPSAPAETSTPPVSNTDPWASPLPASLTDAEPPF
jgi:hypothetical protein